MAYTTSYAYDALNRPTGITFSDVPAATPPPAGALVAFGHSYNAVNQRIGQTVSDSTWLAYPAATPSATAYTANALNQYTAAGAVTPTWDANGNLTFDGTGTYGYDAENRLISAAGGGHSASYRYDAQGRRSARTVDGTTTISVTDADDREVLEYDGTTGQVLRWYAYGLGPNAVLGQMDVVAGTRSMPIPDLLGSVIASVDAGSGTISKSGYLPYGGSGTPATPFGFTGQRLDAETGLYSYRARHYSTAFGRFLQTDPIGYVAGANLYAYVGNDPLNALDPYGLLSLSGVLRFAGGTAEAAIGLGFGVASSWTGVGAVAGGVIALHGLDVALAAWRGTDTATSQGLQAAGVSQTTANAIDTGISGVAFIAAGAPVLSYAPFGVALAGGGVGTSLLSATARGFVVPTVRVEGVVTVASGAAWKGLKAAYRTADKGGLVGRAASSASQILGYGLETWSLTTSSEAYGTPTSSEK